MALGVMACVIVNGDAVVAGDIAVHPAPSIEYSMFVRADPPSEGTVKSSTNPVGVERNCVIVGALGTVGVATVKVRVTPADAR